MWVVAQEIWEANIDLKVIAEQMVVEITDLTKMFQGKGLTGIRRVQMKKLGKTYLYRKEVEDET